MVLQTLLLLAACGSPHQVPVVVEVRNAFDAELLTELSGTATASERFLEFGLEDAQYALDFSIQRPEDSAFDLSPVGDRRVSVELNGPALEVAALEWMRWEPAGARHYRGALYTPSVLLSVTVGAEEERTCQVVNTDVHFCRDITEVVFDHLSDDEFLLEQGTCNTILPAGSCEAIAAGRCERESAGVIWLLPEACGTPDWDQFNCTSLTEVGQGCP